MNDTDKEQQIDLEAAAKLVEALARDLEKVRSDDTAVQRLKDEVETLRNVLGSPVRRHRWVRDGLHGIRDAFDAALETAVADGFKASRYMAEIGRILGM